MILKNKYLIFIIAIFLSFNIGAQNFPIKIIGNEYIDQDIVLSLLDNLPENIDDLDKSNLIEQLNNSGYFESIEISSLDNSLVIKLKEYPIFKEVHFKKNKRFKKDTLLKIFQNNNEYNIYNQINVNRTIDQYYDLYKSFGYNSINVDYEVVTNDLNEIDIYFTFDEGKISKIRTINFVGNDFFSKSQLLNQIKSRERNYLNFIFNSNFKINVLNNDLVRLLNHYQNNGFRNVKIDMKFEFDPNSNYFDVFFNINEGSKYYIKSININEDNQIFNESQLADLNSILELNYSKEKLKEALVYDENFLNDIKSDLSNYIFDEGLYFFEISLFEKVENEFVSVLFDINSTEPSYVTNIDIIGNSRTKDSIIRRELEFSEGDAINDILISKSIRNINRLGILNSANIEKNEDDSVSVKVEEKSTGSFQVGLGFNSYDGATFVAELKENNFQGTGRAVNFTFNNSSGSSKYKLGFVEPYIFDKKFNLIYNIEYTNDDRSSSSSYKLDNFNTEIGLDYELLDNLSHRVTLGYSLKDYEITDKNKVSTSILDLDGSNAQFNLNNTFTFNRLDSLIKPTEGDYTNFTNTISPVTNSTDGFTKNTINFRKYYLINGNIYSLQSLLGNVVSFQNETIDNDEKFSLGGRWLRGFDSYGAGPRDSASSYIGGNNVAIAKFDLLRPLDKFSDNPIYVNLFTDIGKVWSNKNAPTYNNEGIRASYGFGLHYYSPIGPIGFNWGFPIEDEPEDIKRMFTFSIGYLN